MGLIVPYTAEQWAEREAQVLDVRDRLEKLNVYPYIHSIALVLSCSDTATERVISRLKARSAWPPSPVPRTRPGEAADRLELAGAVRRGLQGGKVDVEKATAAIRERWTEATELLRRATGRRVEARIPGWSGVVPRDGGTG